MSGNGNGNHTKLGYTGEQFEALKAEIEKPEFVPTLDVVKKLIATVDSVGNIALNHKMDSLDKGALLSCLAVMICNNVPIPASKERNGFLVPKQIIRHLDPKGHLEINERKAVMEVRFAVPQKIIQLANRMPGK